MINTTEILETIQMITEEHLDIRTITMGISLLDCCDPDIDRACEKIYRKITQKAKNLVKTGEDIEKEYGIPLTEDLRKDVNVMCNLSQGIVDDTEMKIVINMYKNNFTLEQISLATKKSIAEIERIINENSIALPQR